MVPHEHCLILGCTAQGVEHEFPTYSHALSFMCSGASKALVTCEFLCIYVNVCACRREKRKGEREDRFLRMEFECLDPEACAFPGHFNSTKHFICCLSQFELNF